MEANTNAPGALTPPNSFPENEVVNGTYVVYLRNTALAAALVAVGVPLRKDPPYTYRVENGERVIFWHFEAQSKDGMFQTGDLLKAWKKDLEFITENPMHPFTFAMLTQKAFRILNEETMRPNELLWCDQNPMHPASLVMQSVHNFARMANHINADVPFVGFRPPESTATLYVKRDSAKHRKCVELGLIQI